MIHKLINLYFQVLLLKKVVSKFKAKVKTSIFVETFWSTITQKLCIRQYKKYDALENEMTSLFLPFPLII